MGAITLGGDDGADASSGCFPAAGLVGTPGATGGAAGITAGAKVTLGMLGVVAEQGIV